MSLSKRYKREFRYGLSFARIAVISIKKEPPVLEYIDRGYVVTFYRPNDRACTPIINQPIDRQALYLTTITTAAGTVLLPKQTFATFTYS